jgi:hypothetical protein
MTRKTPYLNNKTVWHEILNKNIIIPMNQREYSWGNSEIKKFLDDILYIFKETNYVEKMGVIINYTYNNNNEIYDGQQRTLTIVLLLLVLAKNCDKLKSKIYNLLSLDKDTTRITDTLKKQIEKIDSLSEKLNIEINIIPKIYCVNPYDRDALVRIFNNNVNNVIDYIKNIESLNTDSELLDQTEYICKECDTKINRKTDFKRHLVTIHKINFEINPKSKLYNGYTFINEYMKLKKYESNDYIDLYNFVVYDIDIQIYNCDDSFYVSKIFDWENNRGKDVEVLDIIKNPIL